MTNRARACCKRVVSKSCTCSAISLLLAVLHVGVVKSEQRDNGKMELQRKSFEAIADRQQPYTEQLYLEDADWFGKTGLSEQIERSLTWHLRRQFGQSSGDQGTLTADDLVYLGANTKGQQEVHHWEIQTSKVGRRYVYLFIDRDGALNISLGSAPNTEKDLRLPQE